MEAEVFRLLWTRKELDDCGGGDEHAQIPGERGGMLCVEETPYGSKSR